MSYLYQVLTQRVDAWRAAIAFVECTLSLLRADSKQSKLSARAAALRESLSASNMKHIRVLPILVSALSAEQVKVDIPAAEENGVLVLTWENLISALEAEMPRFPDANAMFARAIAHVQERQATRVRLASEETSRQLIVVLADSHVPVGV